MDYLYKCGRKISMKVFISWFGTRSKKVAVIFRDWLPTVIQALDPFVSSEDIEKGSRWNTDIAQELKEAKFGLICVTKDNLNSPWLNFEAGALSKTIENSYVAPILFDVKPSELTGSPISQFQATSFSEEDMKRLVETLNTAAGNCLTNARLNKAFELCYPDLEKSLNNLKEDHSEHNDDKSTDDLQLNSDILEELLEVSRNTQRLLGNTDTKIYNNINQLQKRIEDIIPNIEKKIDIGNRRILRRGNPALMEDMIFYFLYIDSESDNIFPYNILIVLSFYKDALPWLYDADSDLVKVLESKASDEIKEKEINKFKSIIDYTCSNPAVREMFAYRKDIVMLLRELPSYFSKILDKLRIKIE